MRFYSRDKARFVSILTIYFVAKICVILRPNKIPNMFNNNIIYQVDSFTTERFKGNPAGVVLLEEPVSVEWMQNIAMEMNLSETAFVIPKENKYKIKYYTPANEIDICGHATLASAHIMYELGIVGNGEEIVFDSNVGDLNIKKEDDFIVMNFPRYSLTKMEAPKSFKEIIGFEPVEIFQSDFTWVLAVAENEEEITKANPQFSRMIDVGLGHLIVTAKSTIAGTDFVVRCFAPISGVNEDPVTGSAHCALTPYWTEALSTKIGDRELNSLQVSKRTGRLKVKMIGDRVQIRGNALTVFKLEIV